MSTYSERLQRKEVSPYVRAVGKAIELSAHAMESLDALVVSYFTAAFRLGIAYQMPTEGLRGTALNKYKS